MDTLPLQLKLKGEPCLLVGGGTIAFRKLSMLLRAEASVTVVAPEISEAIASLIPNERLRRRRFEASDVTGCRLVMAATGDHAVNRTVFDACQEANILINAVDDSELCTVMFPAIVDRSPIQIAIGSSGRAPALARIVRSVIERALPPGIGKLAEFLQARRDRIKAAKTDLDERVHFYDDLWMSGISRALEAGNADTAEQLFEEALTSKPAGEVAIVGAGPGDAELLTLKALRYIERADVLLYDNLIGPDVLEYARRDAEKIYVGKRKRSLQTQQDRIHELMIEHASAGRRVVRLKGGDPFIFGRGGEEVDVLRAAGIAYTVVPAVTAAIGCAAYAGIPLTHRDAAQSVRFVTGHRKEDRINLDWPELALPNQTLVLYMARGGLREICAELIAHGRAAQTPAAVIENGTRPDQRVLRGTLETLPALVESTEFTGPTITIVGEVVALAPEM